MYGIKDVSKIISVQKVFSGFPFLHDTFKSLHTVY